MCAEHAITVREYDVKDFAVLTNLVAEFFTFHRHLQGRGPLPPEEAAIIIPQDMLQEFSQILVAETTEGKDVIGFCRVELHEGAYFLRELGVTENWRIRGVGTALLRAAEDYIRELGKSNLYLSVVPRNIDAVRFFVRRGYDILNTMELRTATAEEKIIRKPLHFLGLQFRY
ncbi:MAG: GNAT family N-acetyltransferase [Promethearchaeota archaeon]